MIFVAVYIGCVAILVLVLFLGVYTFNVLWTDSDINIIALDIPYSQEMKEQLVDDVVADLGKPLSTPAMENPFQYVSLDKVHYHHQLVNSTSIDELLYPK